MICNLSLIVYSVIMITDCVRTLISYFTVYCRYYYKQAIKHCFNTETLIPQCDVPTYRVQEPSYWNMLRPILVWVTVDMLLYHELITVNLQQLRFVQVQTQLRATRHHGKNVFWAIGGWTHFNNVCSWKRSRSSYIICDMLIIMDLTSIGNNNYKDLLNVITNYNEVLSSV